MEDLTEATAPRPARRAGFAWLVKVGAAALLVFAGGALAPTIAGAVIGSGSRDVFVPLPPARIFDTRDGTGLVPATPAKIGAGQTVEFAVRGVGGVSASATAAVLNITAVNGSAASHLTVFPGATAAPNASSLNFGPNQTVPNAVTVKIGTNGKVAVRNNSGSVDVIADVNGYYDDHNHDDRYYTKGQIDGKFASSDYVGSAQIIDGSVTQADRAFRNYSLSGNFSNVSFAARECKAYGQSGLASQYPVGRLTIPSGTLPDGFYFVPGVTMPSSVAGFNVVSWQICSIWPTTQVINGSYPYVVRVEL